MTSNYPISARYQQPTLREVATNSYDNNAAAPLSAKDRVMGAYAKPSAAADCGGRYQLPPSSDLAGRRSGSFDLPTRGAGSTGSATHRASSGARLSGGTPTGGFSAAPSASPGMDRAHRSMPYRVPDFAQEIVEMFLQREKSMARDGAYLARQTEVNEKMRTILVDWMVDVCLKFKLHAETFFLAVDIVDRYLATTVVSRPQLQLVGVVAVLLAAKYEEIYPPEIKDCIHISANTYTREDIIRMERAVTAALKFKLTVPTVYPLMARMLDVTDSDDVTRHVALYFLEHAVLDYKGLLFLPSQIAYSCLYLAHVTLRRADPWNFTHQYYSKAKVDDFRDCARNILEYVNIVADSKYQAIRRKYRSGRYSEVTSMSLPAALPME